MKPALLKKLATKRIYFDTNVLIYFLEGVEPFYATTKSLFAAIDKEAFQAYTGDAAVAEILVLPYRLNLEKEVLALKAFFAKEGCMTVLSHSAEVFDATAQLRAKSKLRTIDALHLATAIGADCDYFVTFDKDFTHLPSNLGIDVLILE